jgi:hypothetical protein
MECERFKKLLKSWYIQVQNESLAPARMVDFMENHVAECSVCIMDPEAKKDIAKIITLVLPQDKLKQTVRTPHSADQDDLADDLDDAGTNATEEEEVVEDEDDTGDDSFTDDESDDEAEGDDIDDDPELKEDEV